MFAIGCTLRIFYEYSKRPLSERWFKEQPWMFVKSCGAFVGEAVSRTLTWCIRALLTGVMLLLHQAA